jgi:hypothetical protein
MKKFIVHKWEGLQEIILEWFEHLPPRIDTNRIHTIPRLCPRRDSIPKLKVKTHVTHGI